MGDISIANVSIDSEVFVARTENNSMYTTSKDIAEKFGKRHDHVLRDIKKLATQNGGAKSLFHETTYENRGKQYPMYLVTRDGFTLLAMGFTGANAFEWKMKYISAFNRMAEIIRNELNQVKKQMPQRGTKEFLSLALLDAQQIIEEQERKLIDAQPAIVFHQAVAVTEDTILVREFAKLLTQALRKEGYNVSIGEKKMFEWLRENDYLIKQKSNSFNMPTQKSVDMNLFMIKETTIQGDHGPRLNKTSKMTGKGQQYFMDKILEIYRNGGSIK